MKAWARLVVSEYSQWARHYEEDGVLSDVIRKGGLEVGSAAKTVDAYDLSALCRYQMVFTDNLVPYRDRKGVANLREYIYRGGSLYIEVCHNPSITPDIGAFHRAHHAYLLYLLPGTAVARLPVEHPIFRELYPISAGQFAALGTDGIYAFYDDDRIVVVLGELGLRCAWIGGPLPSVKQHLAANIHAHLLRQSTI